ncbi:orotate phosphoribosyltransferase [Oceanobacillus picturae]|uniref:orotate phosphoribosyltransferase n=1 Tax=Oceanobacillus picturae TaxID=171693 RepID=UPI000E69BC43|nr:orotate phosphoribosyltransferase [Oceanobacillus picturae]RIU96430.1 orotate phosphoribosyltransferase [Oceanobacillus picturae]
MVLSYELARDLLDIKAVQVNPSDYFTWTSGIKSPIYCDNRLTMSHPQIRRKITKAFMEMIDRMPVKPDVIAGCATAGIPHAAWLADKMDLPMVYVRSKPKGHGKGNQIEGACTIGAKVLVIEDLISTGGSSLETARVLQEQGAEVLGVHAIFSYGLNKSAQLFEKENICLETITGYDELLDVMEADNRLTKSEHEQLINWRNDL